jgi:hypothetical protein
MARSGSGESNIIYLLDRIRKSELRIRVEVPDQDPVDL